MDISINLTALLGDIHSVGAIRNANFSKGRMEGGSVLDSPEEFFGKADLHRFHSSFVLRYRAIWDKLMGLLILLGPVNTYGVHQRSVRS